ncbi:MAG TPA: long-chain fatty acid--CoA ligase [Acidimicrobiales bacterium]|nr:long-chain fatty acid--CoA ligase [Acidimicrobiales bacterium]
MTRIISRAPGWETQPHGGVPDEQGDTIVSALQANARIRPDRPAMRHRDGSGKWEVITWGGYQLAARQVAQGLAELGLEPGARAAVLGANRPEWHLADLGILSNGGVTVPIYPTSFPAQVLYVLGHSKSEVCFVDTHEQLGKVLQVRDELPHLKRVVLSDRARRATDEFVIGFDELRALGVDREQRDPDDYERRLRGIGPDDLATIVYTSGTTGPPKGTMISHGNIMWTLRNVTPVYGITEGERLISFLPLSHIAERMMSDFTPIAVRGETWFARSLATVAEDLPECRPTVFLAVPRVWEKLRQGIEDQVRKQPLPLRTAVSTYLELGLRRVAAEQEGRSLAAPLTLTFQALDRVIGAGIRRQIGLDQFKVVVSAAAPIHPDLIRWFHAIGLPMVQIYGQTEGCGPTTAHRLERNTIGTVGTALPGMTVVVAEDGEILLKGGNVCMGYLDDPAATAALIDEEGWMHTGDTGVFDENGDLHITGRKKDLIITAQGKNITPQEIESDLCNVPLISEAVVVGEGRKYLTALVTLDGESVSRWAVRRNKLDDLEALTQDPDLTAEIQAAVDAINAKRSTAESVRKFKILPHDLTAAAGELTPTMKVKRAVVYERYADAIEGLYAGD